jgi:3-oxoacyl-[acyl-carrier protein] reductase
VELHIAGKCALVTGSTSGIGAAVAEQLAEEGVRVVVHGRRSDAACLLVESIRACGGQCWAALGDLTLDRDADGVVHAALEKLGQVDILVNNAGSYDLASSWSTLTPAAWLERLNANIVSAVRVVRPLLAPMRALGWGRIINVGSTDAVAPGTGLPEYAASKAALANLTLTLSRELRGSGVTVNTITPGAVLTGTVLAYLRTVAEQREWDQSDDAALAQRGLLEVLGAPPGGWGTSRHIAYVVAMLCSPRADWLNGADIRIDGGS